MLSIPGQFSTVRADPPEIPASTYDSQLDSLKSTQDAPDSHGCEPPDNEQGSTAGTNDGFGFPNAGLRPVDRIQGQKRPLQAQEEQEQGDLERSLHRADPLSSQGSTDAMDTTCDTKTPTTKPYQAISNLEVQQSLPHHHHERRSHHPKRRKMSNIIHPVEVGQPSDEDSP
jgi:hypothetical protein